MANDYLETIQALQAHLQKLVLDYKKFQKMYSPCRAAKIPASTRSENLPMSASTFCPNGPFCRAQWTIVFICCAKVQSFLNAFKIEIKIEKKLPGQ